MVEVVVPDGAKGLVESDQVVRCGADKAIMDEAVTMTIFVNSVNVCRRD